MWSVANLINYLLSIINLNPFNLLLGEEGEGRGRLFSRGGGGHCMMKLDMFTGLKLRNVSKLPKNDVFSTELNILQANFSKILKKKHATI